MDPWEAGQAARPFEICDLFHSRQTVIATENGQSRTRSLPSTRECMKRIVGKIAQTIPRVHAASQTPENLINIDGNS